jgi:hypothetical protein
MEKIEVFLQGVAISRITAITVKSDGHVQDIIEAAKAQGLKLPEDQKFQVWLENSDEPLDTNETLINAGIKKHSRLHVHVCHRIKVTVNYQNKTETHPFAPSTTIGVVKKWADKKFGLSDVDATEHALQLCNSVERPSVDVHLGSLVTTTDCAICFDLVPKQRIEG